MKPIEYLFPAMVESHRHNIIEDDGTTLLLQGTCPITKDSWTLRVDKVGYTSWLSGALIQKALPRLSSDERELILSGTTAEGWKLMCGDEE